MAHFSGKNIMSEASFETLKTELAAHGPDAVLSRVVAQLRGEKKYHELFEALKMQVRRKLGMPLASAEGSDGLSEAKRNELEEGLIAACREVGTLLMKEGKVREGWMYLRPVGDKVEAAKLLAELDCPALTEAYVPPAVLADPPLTEAAKLMAPFPAPPLTEAESPLAVLPDPPLTEAAMPLAMLLSPPLTEA